jgi:hypothetical protein
MQWERDHGVGKEDAARRVNTLLDRLLTQELPGGVHIVKAVREWTEDRMVYSFTAKKGILRARVDGSVWVSEQRIVFDCTIPTIIAKLVGEEKINEAVADQFNALFPEGNV